jgi:tetratricopeptide (TPR) repeat protein
MNIKLALLPVLFCLVFSFTIMANKADSLQKVLKTLPDTAKFKVYNQLIDELANHSFEKCLIKADERLTLARKLNDGFQIATSIKVIGLYTHYKGDSKQAVRYFKDALKMFQELKNFDEAAQLLSNIGAMHELAGNYDSAIINYQQSLILFERLQKNKGIAFVQNNLGIVYEELGQHRKAIEHHLISLKIKQGTKDKRGIASTSNNLGVAYENLGDYKNSVKYYNDALLIYQELNYTKGIATLSHNIGHVFQAMKDYGKARGYFKQALDLRQKLGDMEGVASTLNYWGNLCTETDDFANAGLLLNKSLRIADSLKIAKTILLDLEGLHNLAVKQNDYKKALDYYKKFTALNDSLKGADLQKKIAQLSTQFDTERKEHKILMLTKENQMNNLSLSRSRILVGGLIGLLLVLAIAGYFFVRSRRVASEMKNIELEQKLLRSQMNPHFLFNALSVIQSYMYGEKAQDAARYLSKFARLMRLILENSRQEEISLTKELETVEGYLALQKMRYGNKFTYTLQVNGIAETDELNVPPMLVQPFIENAIEHGIVPKEGTGHIDVNYKLSGSTLLISVSDDGIGRKKAGENQARNNKNSLATTITQERMANINRYQKNKVSMKIMDLESGTEVRFEVIVG